MNNSEKRCVQCIQRGHQVILKLIHQNAKIRQTNHVPSSRRPLRAIEPGKGLGSVHFFEPSSHVNFPGSLLLEKSKRHDGIQHPKS